jgi:hypothetical protein
VKFYIIMDWGAIAAERQERALAKARLLEGLKAEIRAHGGLAALSDEVVELLGPLADEIRAEAGGYTEYTPS